MPALAGALAVIPLFLLQAPIPIAFCSHYVAAEAIVLSMRVVSFPLTPSGQKGKAAAATATLMG